MTWTASGDWQKLGESEGRELQRRRVRLESGFRAEIANLFGYYCDEPECAGAHVLGHPKAKDHYISNAKIGCGHFLDPTVRCLAERHFR